MLLLILFSIAPITASAPISCPSGTVADPISNVCYLYSSTKTDFLSAQSQCRQNGGQLSSVASGVQNNFISGDADQQNISGNLWIGLTSVYVNDASWEWIDKTPVAYTNWKDNAEPIPNYPYSCTGMDVSSGQWSAFDCGEELNFVCTVPTTDGRTTRPPVVTTPPKAGCEGEGWTYFNNSCFMAANETDSLTHAQADEVCSSLSAQLASIHSKHENDLILGLGTGNDYRWIGLWRNTSMVFVWSDGGELDYTNWMLGTPTRNSGFMYGMISRDAGLDHGLWTDVSYKTFTNGVICRKAATNFS